MYEIGRSFNNANFFTNFSPAKHIFIHLNPEVSRCYTNKVTKRFASGVHFYRFVLRVIRSMLHLLRICIKQIIYFVGNSYTGQKDGFHDRTDNLHWKRVHLHFDLNCHKVPTVLWLLKLSQEYQNNLYKIFGDKHGKSHFSQKIINHLRNQSR